MKSTNRHAPTLEILSQTLTVFGRLGIQLSSILKTEDHRRAVSVAINPKGYSDWRDFFLDYSALSLVKKYPFLNLPGVNPRLVAEQKFRESELRCREKNFMFAHPSSIPHESYSLLLQARRNVRRILGKFSWDGTLPFLSHGPGATYRTRKDRGHPWYKFGDIRPTVTGEGLALHNRFLTYCELWRNFHNENAISPEVVSGSKVTTVPKDARCDRVIAIEPLLNMFYQKGLGGYMRSRLKRFGCNLNDQTINQKLALQGSRDNSLATIDLSSASDTVSRGLVEFLLPEDWLTALKSVRSDYTDFCGEKIFLQKFSSMGNGYTFELESLIFLALGLAVNQRQNGSTIAVYGDDIIVESKVAHHLINLLRVCGFATNHEKTFIDGPFRESCGKHYFLGYEVTPMYVKADIQTQDRYLWYLNSVRRFAFRLLGMGYGCADALKPLYDSLYERLSPESRSLSIPDGFGDGGIVRDFDECVPRPKPQKGLVEGYVTRHRLRVYCKAIPHGWPQLLVSLLAPGKLSCGYVEMSDSFRMRGDTPLTGPIRDFFLSASDGIKEDIPLGIPKKRYRWAVSRLSVPRWGCLGPWVSLG